MNSRARNTRHVMLARDAFESRIGAKRTGDQQEKSRIENFVGGLALRRGGELR